MSAQGAALRLLVAVDGSEHAAGALRLVVALARRGARLHVVLLNVQKPVMVGEVGAIAPASIALETRDRAAAEVLEAASRVLAEADVMHDRLEEIEDPAVAITAVAQSRDCHAIVVGSRGLGRLRSALLGSVSSEVIRGADCPVIVVGSPDPVLPEGPLRILAAVDGSEGATRALSCACAVAHSLPNQELHILHVQPPLSLAETLLGSRERLIEHWSAAGEESVFTGARALLEGRGYEYSARFAQDYAPAEAIARTAEELRCGMISLGTRGLGPMAGLLLGSVAQGVLQRVRVPVILAR